MVRRAHAAGLNHFDTAPLCGHGLSKLRLGHALRWTRRDSFVLSTKVGRLLTPAPRESSDFAPRMNAAAFTLRFDCSYDGAMRSIEDSLQRLALERIEIVFIHDCDRFTHGPERQPRMFEAAMSGAARALLALRHQGVVKSVGLGVNEWEVCLAGLERHDFDAFLLAGRDTLLEQDALDQFLPLCVERGASIALGGGYNSGILAIGAVPGAKYNDAPAPASAMGRPRRSRRSAIATESRSRRPRCSSCSRIRPLRRSSRKPAPWRSSSRTWR